VTDPNCIFCRIAAGEIPGDIVYQDNQVVAFRDIQPVAPTHVLVIPREHIASVSALNPSQAQLAGALLLAAGAIAEQEGLSEAGYRIVTNTGPAAGQTVFHLHLHILGGRQLGTMG
jgi:histidine triad (HIT) family protein